MITGREPCTGEEWLTRMRDGLTATERADLADWLRESPANIRDLLQATTLDADLAELAVTPDRLERWIAEARDAAFSAEIIPLGETPRFPPRPPRHPFGPRWRVAALAVVVTGVLIAATIALFPARGERYATQLGEQQTITLADGSVVTLNTDSVIRVQLEPHLRSVELLRGEAYFHVVHNAARPFVVKALGATIQDVGTEFDVRMAEHSTLVSVIEGRVLVLPSKEATRSGSAATDPAPVALSRGDEVRISDLPGAMPAQWATRLAPGAALRSVAWTEGRIDFDATPLEQVFAEFARYHPLHVRIEDPALRAMKVSGSFNDHDPAAALAYVATLPGVKVQQTGRHRYLISRAPAN